MDVLKSKYAFCCILRGKYGEVTCYSWASIKAKSCQRGWESILLPMASSPHSLLLWALPRSLLPCCGFSTHTLPWACSAYEPDRKLPIFSTRMAFCWFSMSSKLNSESNNPRLGQREGLSCKIVSGCVVKSLQEQTKALLPVVCFSVWVKQKFSKQRVCICLHRNSLPLSHGTDAVGLAAGCRVRSREPLHSGRQPLPSLCLTFSYWERETVITQESYMTWFTRACNALSQKEKGSWEKMICSLRLTWAIVTSHTPGGEFSSCIPVKIPLWGWSLSPWPSTAQELDDAAGN